MADSEAFVKFVAAKVGIDEALLPEPGQMSEAGNTIGAMCLRLGLLSMDQIDQIIEAQANDKAKRFGQIAVDLGFVTDHQVERVLYLQRLYRSLEHGALLVLDGRLELRRLLVLLTEYVESGQHR